MSAWSEFFLATHSDVAQLETLVISHPSFSQTYRIVRNAVAGVTIGGNPYAYYPLRVSFLGSRDNLDFGLRIELGDLGEVLPLELDLVVVAGTRATKPTVTYATYRSDDHSLLYGPVVLEAGPITFSREGAFFEARAPRANVSGTGERYSIVRFPMLRGLL